MRFHGVLDVIGVTQQMLRSYAVDDGSCSLCGDQLVAVSIQDRFGSQFLIHSYRKTMALVLQHRFRMGSYFWCAVAVNTFWC